MKKLTTMFTVLAFSTALGALGCQRRTNDVTGSPKPVETNPTMPSTTGSASGSADLTGSGSAYNAGPGAAGYGSASSSGSGSGSTMSAGSNVGSNGAIEANTGIAACDQYVKVYNRFSACEGLSTSARDSAKSDVDRLQKSWTGISPTAAATDKAAASDACTTATETLEQAAKAVNCNL